MNWPMDPLLWAGSLAVTIPSAVYFGECAVATLLGRAPGASTSDAQLEERRVVVLVPAHDEAAQIEQTLRGLQADLPPHTRLLVIADNCTDATADIARGVGAEVLERRDETRRGKGYAIAYAVEHLAADPPDVVIIIDADCEVGPGSLQKLVSVALTTGRPVQADYILRVPDNGSPRTQVSAFAFVVRNRVRPLGLHRLGMPCHLTGTGMAFPWRVLQSAPQMGDHLVEDLAMGLELARQGFPPVYCQDATVTSVLPENDGTALGQRRRWEHGQMSVLAETGPRLLALGIRKLRLDLIVLALDLMVPPLALLVLVVTALVVLSSLNAVLGGATGPQSLALLSAFAVLSGTGMAWWRFGRQLLPASAIPAVFGYVLWKIPMYVAFGAGKRQRQWNRTKREAEANDDT